MNFDQFSSFFNQYFIPHSTKQLISIGKATFKPNIIQGILTQNIQKIIYANLWYIVNGSYSKLRFYLIFKEMSTSLAKQIHLTNNKIPNIIVDFQHIEFKKLQILNLSDNKIQSIQALSWIQLNSIRQIEINFNCIVTIKCLNKIKYHTLTDLRLNQNKINELSFLSRMLFSLQNTSLRFQSYNHPVLDEDIAFVAKLYSKTMKNLVCLSSQRIFNEIKTECLLKKYIGSSIASFEE